MTSHSPRKRGSRGDRYSDRRATRSERVETHECVLTCRRTVDGSWCRPSPSGNLVPCPCQCHL